MSVEAQSISVELSPDEREVLCHGVAEWGGPAACTDELAVAMGFNDLADFSVQRSRLLTCLQGAEPLTTADWRKSLVATEIVFISEVFGSGSDWSHTTGLSDEETVKLIRSLQAKVPW